MIVIVVCVSRQKACEVMRIEELLGVSIFERNLPGSVDNSFNCVETGILQFLAIGCSNAMLL